MKVYTIKECFPTFQGEGLLAGRRAVFLRMAGCNAWTGRPQDRDTGKADCSKWCDTDFVGGTKMTVPEVIALLEASWSGPFGSSKQTQRMVVITGGEPTLQLEYQLVKAMHDASWFIAIETNGSVANPMLGEIDHVCVSPKRGLNLEIKFAHELKVVLPGGWSWEELRKIDHGGNWMNKFVQPCDQTDPAFVGVTHLSRNRITATAEEQLVISQGYQNAFEQCQEYCKAHPGWRISIQGHKYLGLR